MMTFVMHLEFLAKGHVSLIASIAFAVAGCGGGSGGGGGGASGTTHDAPTDTSSAGISAFVEAGSYLTPPWQAETSAPRDAATSVSPHGRVKVWLDPAAASETALNDITPDAMAVKEMYDTSDQLVGRAVIIQTTSTPPGAVYWCVGPAGRCGDGEPEYTSAAPLYGGASTSCHGCHGGAIFTRLP